jgi:ubiquinone/menaquinone biosynthesis C-methylase UbiE
MTWQDQYQQDGGSAADLFQRYIVPRITSVWGRDLVGRAGVRLGENVLDVACGTGVVAALAAAQSCTGRVVGLDLNADMLRVARGNADEARAQVEWCEGSALALPFGENAFDVVLCQLGLQFFPDKSLALREMARVLRPEGRLALSVFTGIERTPIAYAFANALDRHLGEDASLAKRAEHSFSDSTILAQLAIDAGLKNVVVVPVTLTIRFPSAHDYVWSQLTATPQARLLSKMPGHERDALIQAIANGLTGADSLGQSGEVSSAQECNVLTATR